MIDWQGNYFTLLLNFPKDPPPPPPFIELYGRDRDRM
jgi:hypothetical protein